MRFFENLYIYINDNIADSVDYALMLISIAMIIDVLTGIISAKMNPYIDVTSKRGINGLIKKILIMTLLLFFLLLAPLIPEKMGYPFVLTLYYSYLFMELVSIKENFNKMDINTEFIERVITKVLKDKGGDKDGNHTDDKTKPK